MIKKITLLAAMLTVLYVNAQIPTGYYNSATGVGFILKTQLKKIINNTSDGLSPEYLSTDNGYSSLYNGYQTTDIDNFTAGGYENDNTVLDMYSESASTAMSDPYNFNHNTNTCGSYSGEGQCYNREHLFPQGYFNSKSPMVADIHFVTPTDGYVNNRRSNYPFGIVTSPTWTSQNGSKVGANTSSPDYTGIAFEPIDEYKGDIARMLLYFATRYEDEVPTSAGFNGWDDPNAVAENPLNGTSDQVYETWYINLLLSWHNTDPVSPREVSRNNACFTYQNNRNPFIDHPEWVNAIWNPTPDNTNPSDVINLLASNPSATTIDLTWDIATDNVGVSSYDIYQDNVLTYNSTTNTFTATGLANTTNYCYTIKAKDAAGNTSVNFSNQSCATTLTGSGGSSCANEDFENIPSNSASYSTRTWTGIDGITNGWTATNARTDQTLTIRSITMRNGILTSPPISGGIGDLTISTQRTFSGGAGEYELFINGISKGTIPYDATVQTTTISNINELGNIVVEFKLGGTGATSDRVKFDDLSWTCYSAPLTVNSFNFSNINIYPNPIIGNYLFANTSEDLNATIYNLLGKTILTTRITKNNNQINLTNLQSGIYLIKLANNKGSITKKIIKQ